MLTDDRAPESRSGHTSAPPVTPRDTYTAMYRQRANMNRLRSVHIIFLQT